MGEAEARAGGPGLTLTLALTALWIAALLVEQHGVTPQVDDAYIAYRYAANLLAGHGLVFNPGEHVEGFTSPLWVALVALGMRLGLEANAVGHALGLLSGAAAMLGTALYARALAPELPGWIAGLAPGLLLASAPFVRWTTGGLETPLFAAGITASLLAAARRRPFWLAAALVATTLARPEGALLAGVLVAALAVAPDRRRAAAGVAAVYAGFWLLLTLARIAYYGAPLPNTFYAKLSGVPLSFGLLYLGGFLGDGALLLLPPAAIAVARAPAARAGAVFVALFAAYVVAIGGDLLGESRFLVPLLPVLAALGTVGAGLFWRRRPARFALAAACVAGAAAVQVLGFAPGGGETKRARVLDRAHRADRLFELAGRRRAALLRERGVEGATVATGAIGSFGYYSGLPIIDILGLTDPVIAHTPVTGDASRRLPGHLRSNPDSVLARKPDYLLIRRRDTPGAGRLQAVADLWQRPELERDYVWDEALGGYRRRAASPAASGVTTAAASGAASGVATAAASGAASGVATAAASGEPRPNLLLIIVDTLRADHLGCYGSKRNTSPALDALAASGVRFARTWSTAPWTKPAVASILTGLYPSAHRADRVRTTLPEAATTLAEILRAHGYRTAGVVSHEVLAAKNGFAQGFDRWSEDQARGHNYVSTDGVTAHALEMLSDLASGPKPFFLFLHFFDPHYNYIRHPEFGFAAKRAGRLDGTQSLVSLRKIAASLTPEEVGLLRDLYDEEIAYTDRGIGRVLDALRDLGVADHTVVLATADHGEGFLEHGWLGHTRSLYDVLLRVPLIVRAPGIAPRVVDAPVSTISVLPTLLDLLGVEVPAGVQGRSLLPLLRGESLPAAPLYAEVDFLPVFDPAKRANKKALIGPRFKLIHDERGGTFELYDLLADPGEHEDLAAKRPAQVEKLRRELAARARAAATGALPVHDREPSRDELERLRALGYGGS